MVAADFEGSGLEAQCESARRDVTDARALFLEVLLLVGLVSMQSSGQEGRRPSAPAQA